MGLGLLCLGIFVASLVTVSCTTDNELITEQLFQDIQRRRERARGPSPTATITIVPPSVTVTPTRTPRPGRTGATVRRVWDGSTILIEGGYSVRYIGVDTPGAGMFGRPVEPFGREAAQRNVELVEGKEIELEQDLADVNAAGLLLRYVYVDDVLVNEVLLLEGLAYLAPMETSARHAATLRAAEEAARRAPLNLWTLITPTPTLTPTPTDTPTPTLMPTPFGLPVVISPRALPPLTRAPATGVPTPTPLSRTLTPVR